jgi:hypothetical protein
LVLYPILLGEDDFVYQTDLIVVVEEPRNKTKRVGAGNKGR